MNIVIEVYRTQSATEFHYIHIESEMCSVFGVYGFLMAPVLVFG